MTRTMFKSIMTKALEDQKVLADETSTKIAKVAFTERIKEGSKRQVHPHHSSSVDMESAYHSQSSVVTDSDFVLQHIHQLRPETDAAMAPFMVNHATPAHMAANIPPYSTQHGGTDSNKTIPSAAGIDTRKMYKRESNLKYSEGTVDQYASFRSQFNIHHKRLDLDTKRAGIELYMSLEGKAALKVEEVIMNVNGTSSPKCGGPSTVLSCLSIIVNRSIGSLRWRTGERMTEYIDELICLFRPGSDHKNKLLAGLIIEVMEIVAGYLDLTAYEIARKYDVIASKRETLGLSALGSTEKPLLTVQEKQFGSDDSVTYKEFEQVFAFRDSNRQNRFKDETCTYCNKKGHTEVVCFAKRDDDKMSKIAKSISASLAEEISAADKKAMDSILDTLNKMNLKG